MDHLTQLAQFTIDDARALLPQWQLALRAEAKSPGTIDTYTHGLQTYLTSCVRTGEPSMARTTMTTWMSDMLAAGAAPGSVRIRQLAVRRFVAGLIATGHLPIDPFAGGKGPRQTQKLVTPLTDDDLRALIATCVTPTHRAGEPLHHRRAPRVPVTSSTPPTRRLPGAVARRTRSPARLRRSQPGTPQAGPARRRRGLPPHKLRHTAAHRWLAAGGSESGLMAIAGWTRTDMLVRYTRAHASERAEQEAARLNLGAL